MNKLYKVVIEYMSNGYYYSKEYGYYDDVSKARMIKGMISENCFVIVNGEKCPISNIEVVESGVLNRPYELSKFTRE